MICCFIDNGFNGCVIEIRIIKLFEVFNEELVVYYNVLFFFFEIYWKLW